MIRTAYFISSLYIIYLSYKMSGSGESSRRYLSTAFFLFGLYFYILFVLISYPPFSPAAKVIEGLIYIGISFFFYISLKSILGRVSRAALILLGLSILYVLTCPLNPMSHSLKGLVLAFLSFSFIALFISEASKIKANLDEDLRRRMNLYVLAVFLTFTFFIIFHVLSVLFSLPPLEVLPAIVGLSYIYALFRRG